MENKFDLMRRDPRNELLGVAVASSNSRVSPRLLGARDAAFYLGVSESMLRSMSKDGAAPVPKRIGRRLVWDREDLDAFAEELPYEGEGKQRKEVQECDKAFGCVA